MNSSLKYSVEIITDKNKLTAAFALRYNVYSVTYPSLTKNLTQPLECDVYDKRSIHIGLYVRANGEKQLAGYCRFILPAFFKDNYKALLFEEHECYEQCGDSTIEERLFFLSLLPFNKFIPANNQCFLFERHGIIYAETSRLIIDPKYRSIALTQFFTSSIFATAQVLKFDFAFFSCNAHHAPYYKKAGLTPFELTGTYTNVAFNRTDIVFGNNLSQKCQLPPMVKFLKMQCDLEKQMTFERAA